MISRLKSRLNRGTIELLRHGKNYVGANIIVKSLGLISIPILTRLLTPADYGVLAVFNALVSILVIVYGMGIGGGVARYYYEKTDDFGAFLGTNMMFLLAADVLLSVVLLATANSIARLMNIPLVLVKIGGFVSMMTAVFAAVSSYLRASKQSLLVAKLGVSMSTAGLALTIAITYYLKHNRYMGPVYSQALTSTIYCFIGFYLVRKVWIFKPSWHHMKYSLLFGIPIIFHLLSAYVMNSIDQVMINKMVGSAQTGLYALAYKVGMLFEMVIMGMNKSWQPIFYQKMRDEDYQDIDSTIHKYVFLVGLVALALSISAPVLVRVLAAPRFYAALPVVPVVIMGFMFHFFYLIYTGYAFYAKKTGSIATITAISAAFNVVLNYFLIPIYGYQVAAWTTVATFFLFFVLSYANIRFLIRPKRIVPLKMVITPGMYSIFLIYVCLQATQDIKNISILVLIDLGLLAAFVLPYAIKYKLRGKI